MPTPSDLKLTFNSNVTAQVFLGGGRENFIPNTEADPEYPAETGSRSDGRNLIEVLSQVS